MEDDNICESFAKRLKESENTYKVFGFSHIIIIGSITDIMDTSIRGIIDGMYRKTKSHCKTDEEVEMYRQRLCKLYLTYLEKGLVNIERLEPKLSDILTVNVENPVGNSSDRLNELRTKVAERTKRLQSLLALQSRLKTDTVLAEWVISKVGPSVHEAEKDLSNMKCVSPNDVESILNSLNRMKNSFHSLELN
uniref:Uncharacterized protein n=1 Tax=Schizaphis graminum TaxID=13262 RepID=A0A2S2NTS5_SCHGA